MLDGLLHKFVKDADNTSDAKVRSATGQFAGVVGIVCNTLLCGAKMLVGVIAGSVSIVADSLNNLTDAASNVISLLSFKLASKPADKDHPYGHGRYEYLSGLLVAALIIVVGVELLKTSVDKIMNPEPIEFSWALVIVLALSIAVKFWMAAFNKNMGTRINSQTLIATGIDSRNDCISTAAVLLSALVFYFTGFDADAYVGAAVALFIIYSGIGLVRETLDPLLGNPPEPELVCMIEQKAMSYDGILGIHDLMVHDYGPGRVFASFHAEVAAEVDVLDSHEIIDNLEADFRKNENLEVTIHLDPIVTKDPRIAQMRSWVSKLLKDNIDSRITIHDFRMVPGETHTNLIFDAVLPHDNPLDPTEFKHQVDALVKQTYPNYFCVIQVDRDFAGIQ